MGTDMVYASVGVCVGGGGGGGGYTISAPGTVLRSTQWEMTVIWMYGWPYDVMQSTVKYLI